jgi:peptidylprolyl isomerase
MKTLVLILTALMLIAFIGCNDATEEGTVEETPSEKPAATDSAAQQPQLQKLSAELPQISGDTITTETGLKYIDMKVGDGASPATGQTCVMHYTGWLTDGKKFDSSRDRGQPFPFPIGQGRVIKGWDEGVASMKVGGQRLLIIPAELGYGMRGSPPVIPPKATLVFDVELLELK